MWSGTDATVPVGWAICNGQVSGNFGTTPDLRSRFIIGAGPSNLVKLPAVMRLCPHPRPDTSMWLIRHTDCLSLPSHSHRVYACTGTGGSSEVVAFGATGNIALIRDQNNIPKGYTNTNGSARTIIKPAGSGSTHVHGMPPVAAHARSVKRRPGLLCSDVYHQGYGLRPANVGRFKIGNLGAVGLVKDMLQEDLPPEAFTDGRNIRFTTQGAGAFLGHKAIFEATDFPLMWLKPFPPLTAPVGLWRYERNWRLGRRSYGYNEDLRALYWHRG